MTARLQASLKMTNGGERELSAFLKLEAEVERLKADNERTHALVRDVSATRDTAVNMHLKDIAEVARLKAENERAVAECARLNELFALKWDATQSAETEAARAQVELLRVQRDEQDGSIKRLLDDLDAAQTTIERLQAAHRHIRGIAEQAEVYHARMGASQTFAAIADVARAALEPQP